MRAFAWSKNKKGAALIYAVMVLLFLSTLIIAITAISSASYADAVLSVSDDQSYYYAKSIGLAIKEQFKDGYNLDKIITTLDKDGMVSGTFNVSSDDGDMVNGNVQIRYVEDDEGNVNKNIIEVRAACLVNNAISVVTSIYSCEDDSDNEITHMDGALSDYDVILTDPSSATFDFAQASEKWTGTNDLSIYVYAGEDDSVTNPEFKLCVDLDGKLTTTGATKIKSVTSSTNSTLKTHKITGNLTSYGNMTLQYTSVDGMNGIHAKGDVTLQAKSYVKYDIFAKGAVTLENPGEDLHWYYTAFDGSNGYSSSTAPVNHQARNIYAQEKVTLNARAYVSGNILTHGDVELIGKGASAGSTGSAMHFANTCVGGNIYADGDVKIRNGAIVLGSVYAKGNVTIENGASVVGDVQSVSGNIKVLGGAVGGQVNCPNGLLELSNKEKDTYCTYLSEFDFSGTGRTLFGGIGLNHPAGVTYNHTCKQLKTADCECMSVVRGNLYVETATKDGVTYFNSIWCCDGKVYLKDSFAGFIDGSRSCVGANEAGNAYTYIEELNQKADFYDKKNYANNKNPYLNMAGAHIVTLNVGENHARLRDAYCWNGWITNLNARCAYLADVRFGEEVVVEGVRYILGGKIYAAQYVHIWGTGSAASYNLDNYKKTGRPGGVYPYAAAGVTSLLASGITIEVACRTLPSYEGNFLSETNCGFRLGTNAMIDTGTTVYVGSTWSGSSSSLNAYVILGENGAVDTKFYGTLHACVGSFKVGGKTRLSTRRTVNDTAALSAATIYAEITGAENANYANTGIRPAAAAGHFYVEKTATSPHYRYGSKVEVKGNVYLAGELYDFTHFERDGGARFFNKNDGKIRGTLVTTASAVNLTGTNDNFYKVEATNSSATVTLTGALYVYGFKVNGILDTKGYELQVKQGTNALTKDSEGDFYVEKLKTNDIGNVSVARDATINNLQNNSGTLTASTKFFVGRDLTLNHGSIKLDKNGSGVGRILKVSSGNAEIGSGNASHTLKLGSADVNGIKRFQLSI